MAQRQDRADDYRVELEQYGNAGWVYYVEEGRLPLSWEYITDGIGVSVPPPQDWDAYCEEREAAWAKGRRAEILRRVAEGLLKRHSGGDFEIEDYWVNVHFGPSFISRLKDYFR